MSTQKDRLLAALQDAGRFGLTSLDITRLGILRGGARLMELRDAGHVISTERFFSGNSTLFRYTLASESRVGRERTVITAPTALDCETTLSGREQAIEGIGRPSVSHPKASHAGDEKTVRALSPSPRPENADTLFADDVQPSTTRSAITGKAL